MFITRVNYLDMKKSLFTLGLFLIFISAQAQNYTYDVNNDGVVSVTDVTFLVNNILGIPNQGNENYIYDVNDDDLVNVTDVTCLVNHILGIANPGEDETSHLPCRDGNHPHFINLGLPSGTLWACCNVGADKPTDYGGYYAWGETKEKDYYLWDTYTLCGGDEFSCQNLGDDIAASEYDVAHVTWGEPWRMPSGGQVKELMDYCDYEWTTINGVEGMQFTAENGGVIFLPAAGFFRKSDVSADGNGGYYWASSLGIMGLDYASCLYFSKDMPYWSEETRDCGRSVRPVSYSIPNLQLSTTELFVPIGGQRTVDITSGSGNYTVTSNDETVVSASVSNHTVKVRARANDIQEATITVTDVESGQTATITVRVVENLELSTTNLNIFGIGLQEMVVIIAGCGNYAVESSNDEVASAVIENNLVKVKANDYGQATITVTDVKCGETATIQVVVALYDISNAIIYIPQRFLDYSGDGDRHYDYYSSIEFGTEVYASDINGKRCKLTPDEDFIIYIKDSDGNVVDEAWKKGDYTLVVKGIGDYGGEASKSFYIVEGGSWMNHKAAEFSKIDYEHSVITITSEEELALLSSIFNSTVDDQVPFAWWTIRLERDLDLSPYDWTPIGCGRPGDDVGFLAYFDAQGHTIKGVHFDHSNKPSFYYPQGLFGGMTHDGAINDLTLTESQIICSYGNSVGGIVGYIGMNTRVTNCHVTSSVDVICSRGGSFEENHTCNYGGIVGESDGVLGGCTSAANVFKVWNAGLCTSFGGIVGCSENSIIDDKQIINCLYYGDHVFCDSYEGAIAGEIANNAYSKIYHCFYTSDMSKCCNGIDVEYAQKVEAFEMDNIYSVDYGGDMTTSYSYDGMEVYPNAMVYKGVCYAQPQYVQTISDLAMALLKLKDWLDLIPDDEQQEDETESLSHEELMRLASELWE